MTVVVAGVVSTGGRRRPEAVPASPVGHDGLAPHPPHCGLRKVARPQKP